MKALFSILTFWLLTVWVAGAQQATSSVVKSTEFAIPTSPAFDLLAVNPSQISRPSNIRDFKVDWSFRSWRLKPNLAIQTQPLWELLYNRADLSRYRKASPLMRTLSTFDISAGTVEDDAQTRRASLALKLNLFRQRDPLRDLKMFTGIDTSYVRRSQENAAFLNTIKAKRKEKGLSLEQKAQLNQQADSIQQIMTLDARAQKERIQVLANTYVQSYWNASHLDIAFGKLFSYQNASLDSLSLRGQAVAVWLNGSLGVGKKWLITTLVKYLMQEKPALEEQPARRDELMTFGLGLRFGSPKFNFFTEALYTRSSEETVFSDASLNLIQTAPFSLTYGGDWRMNHNVMLSYGVRLDYNTAFKFKNILPVAGVSCMMR